MLCRHLLSRWFSVLALGLLIAAGALAFSAPAHACAAAGFISLMVLGERHHERLRYAQLEPPAAATLEWPSGSEPWPALASAEGPQLDADRCSRTPAAAMGLKSFEVLVYRDARTGEVFWLDARDPALMLHAGWHEPGYVYACGARATDYADLEPDLAAHHFRIHAMLAGGQGFWALAEHLTQQAAEQQAQALVEQSAGLRTCFVSAGGPALDLAAFAAADASSLTPAVLARQHSRA